MDALVLLASMAVLDDRHARASEIEKLLLGALQGWQGKSGWAGVEVDQPHGHLSKNRCAYYDSNKCRTSPLRSFGSNQVDFGGMICPASAIAITCSRLVGCNAKATGY